MFTVQNRFETTTIISVYAFVFMGNEYAHVIHLYLSILTL